MSEDPSHNPRKGRTMPRALVIRLFAYLVAGHLFAGFLYLLFHVGAQAH
jgi:hypothetical protein